MPEYKVRKATRKSATVTFFDTFTVTTPALTRLEEEALSREQMEIRSRGTVDSVGRYDEQTVTLCQYAEADRYIEDFSGLTPDILEAFGIEFDGDGPQPNGDGTIHFDRDVARILWRHAPYQDFASVVIAKSKAINAAHYHAKKKQLSSSASSSAPT